jgi:hypothetical protein
MPLIFCSVNFWVAYVEKKWEGLKASLGYTSIAKTEQMSLRAELTRMLHSYLNHVHLARFVRNVSRILCCAVSVYKYLCMYAYVTSIFHLHHLCRVELYDVRFQVLMAASMMMTTFWDIALCTFIVDRRFGGAYCSHHRTSVRIIEAVSISETSVHFTRLHGAIS